MHFSAPCHPLIYSFLLQRADFSDAKKLIVETREQGEKLLLTLQKLREIEENPTHYILIKNPQDILEVEYGDDVVGIFPIETLDWKISDVSSFVLHLTKGLLFSEEKLLTWLADHHYRAVQSDEPGTYFRRGDTVSIQTRQ